MILTVLLGIKTLNSQFQSSSLCGNTGEILRETEWCIPFTDTVYWTSHSQVDTPISVVIKRYGLAPSAPHNWLFSQGSGNGVICALGDGNHVLGAATASFVADFLDCACRCDEKQFAAAWVKLLLDPTKDNSNNATLAVAVSNMPSGLTDRVAFEKWWNANSEQSEGLLGRPLPDLDSHDIPNSGPKQ